MKKINISIVLLFVTVICFAQNTDTLSASEITNLKALAKLYSDGEILTNYIKPIAISILCTLLAALGTYAFIRKNIENWFIADLSKKLNVTEDALLTSITFSVKNNEIRKTAKILIVNTDNSNAGLKNYLNNLDYKNLQTPMSITEFANVNKSTFDLVIFNYHNKDLSIEQSVFGQELLNCKNKTRAVVIGKNRINDDYSLSLNEFLSLTNGLDTLDDRIVQALKQPLPIS